MDMKNKLRISFREIKKVKMCKYGMISRYALRHIKQKSRQSKRILCIFAKVYLSATAIKLSIFIFLHFRVQYDFLTYLAKFQSITDIRSHSFFTFISENLRPPLLDLVPRLGCELEKMTSYEQKYLTG